MGMDKNDPLLPRLSAKILATKNFRDAICFYARRLLAKQTAPFMRGTSRREDAANWIIQLTEAKEAGETQNGAKFVARFDKNRNTLDANCPALEWHFNLPKGETRARVNWEKISTAQIFRQWIEDGFTSAKDIAEEMHISKGQVSKLAKRGMAEGWLKKDGREYALTGQA